jgi:predicted transposase YbfD/YdcC
MIEGCAKAHAMKAKPPTSLIKYFSSLPDPRVTRTRKHSLHDVLVIAICGMLSGAEDWVCIELFAKAKLAWFKTFLDLPNGIPSHDTFGRVFAAIDPEAFAKCFVAWIQDVAELTEGEVVAIDGKTIRRSFERASGRAAIHMVSAWATKNRVVLGQVKTEDKSNEITAIPRLLELLVLRGCIVTIDAMGCQKEIAQAIRARDAHYVLGLKGNHPKLHTEVAAYFAQARREGFLEAPHGEHLESGRGHGREEERHVWSSEDLGWMEDREQWKGLKTVVMVESKRTVGDKTTREQRYYLSSLSGKDARRLARAIRGHWAVENSLHWVLDVGFREDESRVREGHGAENLSTLRRIALNLLKQDTSKKVGVKNKRLAAGWDEGYMLHLLGIHV